MNSKEVSLISILFLGYFTSSFLRTIFPFISISIHVLWNGIMIEYLGFSVLIYYILYEIPSILYFLLITPFNETIINLSDFLFKIGIATQQFKENSYYLVPFAIILALIQNIALSIAVHKALKEKRVFRFFY